MPLLALYMKVKSTLCTCDVICIHSTFWSFLPLIDRKDKCERWEVYLVGFVELYCWGIKWKAGIRAQEWRLSSDQRKTKSLGLTTTPKHITPVTALPWSQSGKHKKQDEKEEWSGNSITRFLSAVHDMAGYWVWVLCDESHLSYVSLVC